MTGPTQLSVLRLLLEEIGDAKRVRVSHAQGSLAEQAFLRTWARLVAGEDVAHVARSETAAAVARVRLAGLDHARLRAVGLSAAEAVNVLRRAFDEVAHLLPERVDTEALLDSLGPMATTGTPPALADALNRQPRAGATAPGLARVIVEPPESHGDHCFTVAVYGFLLAPLFDADPVAPFLLGVAHHLHNVQLPDAGFAGEVLLGELLGPTMARLEERELDALPEPLAEQVRAVLALRADAGPPEARAFHAADVLDRVLQVHHHARAAAFTAAQALDELQLVHVGPVQPFHAQVLAAAGL